MNQSNQIAKVDKSTAISSLIYGLETNFLQIATAQGVEADFKREALFAFQALQNNDYLMRIAMENPTSLKNAILNVASLGLSANPALAEVYYVPRKGKICADVGYRGFNTLATRGGVMKFIKANVVYAADEFSIQGLGEPPIHKYNPFSKERGEVIGVYCVAALTSGEFLVETMDLAECYEIRDRSESYKRDKSGPWVDHEGEMLKKTVIKRAAKMWPKTEKSERALDEAIRLSNENDGIDFEAEKVEKEEKRKAEAEAAAEQRAQGRAEKDKLLGDITKLCGELTKGFTPQEKGRFMKDVLNVSKFTELNQKTNDELQALSDKLLAIIPIETESVTPPPTPLEEKRVIRNYAPGAENELR